MSGPLAIGFLALGVVALLLPKLRAINWLPLAALALLAILLGASSWSRADTDVRPLFAPVAFVVLAVPMAVMLDTYGVFRELALRISGGPRYRGALWVLASLVTALLNLDAAVVMLAPLYVRVAEQRKSSPLALSIQAALLSSLASSALPVSNLTNLIAVARTHASVSAFLVHLGLPTLVATGVGWLCYRAGYDRIAALERVPPADEPEDAPPTRPAVVTLGVGGALVVAVVAGFVLLPSVGVQPFEVAAVADVVLILLTRTVPWRTLPWQSVVMVLSLGVLAGAAGPALHFEHLVRGSSPLDILRTTGVATLGANVVNNLPALLVTLPATGTHPTWSLWAVLLGTNVGALVLPSASLALVLWASMVRRLGLDVHDGDFLRIGWWICLPALAASTATLVLLRLVLG